MREKIEHIKNLKRIPEKGIIAGICAGIAYYLGAPLWIVRLITAILFITGAHFIPALYILMWIFVPKMEKAPEDFDVITK